MGLSVELDTPWLAHIVGASEITDLRPLLGGASQQMWAFKADGRPLVLRRATMDANRNERMQTEQAVLRRAAAAGVTVPSVVAFGPEYLVMGWVDGETLARRVLRDERYAAARSRLVAQCALQLARWHSVPVADLPQLQRVDPIAALRRTVDEIGEPHPALELGFGWLAAHCPPASPDAPVHGDFRLGNLMIDEQGLAAVLDWELAYIGDPIADLGWLCVRSWRFRAPLPVAGLGTREELLTAYEQAGARPVPPQTLRWWEVLGTLRWAVLCMMQARGHLERGVRSVELAAIGRRVCEVELDLLELLPWASPLPVDVAVPPAAQALCPTLHDRPTAAELLTAAREFLDGLELTGRERFLAHVSSRVLDTVGRELTLGGVLAAEHATRLAELGVASNAELASAIRSGQLAPDRAYQPVRAAVIAKLQVADPSQLSDRAGNEPVHPNQERART